MKFYSIVGSIISPANQIWKISDLNICGIYRSIILKGKCNEKNRICFSSDITGNI